MKEKLVKCLVIYFIGTGGKKMYLTGTSKRFNGDLIPEGWSDDVAEAQTFNTIESVETTVKKIFNIHHREFFSHTVDVADGKKSKILNGRTGNIL